MAAGSVSDRGTYRITDSAAMADLPSWLLRALVQRPAPVARTTAGHVAHARVGAYIQAIVDDETRAVAEARTGTRHRVRLKAARILGELVGGGELDHHTAAQALRDAARRHIGQDCTEHEVENDIRDGLAYGRQRPRRIMRNRT